MGELQEKAFRVLDEVKKVIKGKDDVLGITITAILARGHILLEDIPGVGKTTLAMAFSKAMDLEAQRVQFTPDVLPSDVVGFTMIGKDGQFEYKPGVILCNLFLADEINRTSSKTQSALLEVMEEGQVTVDGVTRSTPKPFVVIATQNPVGSVGTQMLPESQMDRFMVRLTVGYPSLDEEIRLLKERLEENPMGTVEQVVTRQELMDMQEEAKRVFVHDKVLEYMANMAALSRTNPMIELGLSPRGTLALTEMAKATAFLKGRDYVLPEDVLHAFPYVASHRVLLSAKARVGRAKMTDVLKDVVDNTPPPKL